MYKEAAAAVAEREGKKVYLLCGLLALGAVDV